MGIDKGLCGIIYVAQSLSIDIDERNMRTFEQAARKNVAQSTESELCAACADKYDFHCYSSNNLDPKYFQNRKRKRLSLYFSKKCRRVKSSPIQTFKKEIYINQLSASINYPKIAYPRIDETTTTKAASANRYHTNTLVECFLR